MMEIKSVDEVMMDYIIGENVSNAIATSVESNEIDNIGFANKSIRDVLLDALDSLRQRSGTGLGASSDDE
jgi:hypothetical protein